MVSSGVKFSRTKKKYNSRELNAYLLHGKDNSQELLGNPNHNPSQFEFHSSSSLHDSRSTSRAQLINRKGGESCALLLVRSPGI